MNIIKKRRIFLWFSLITTLISIAMLLVFGLKLSIDFTGGSRLEISSQKKLERAQIEKIYSQNGIKISTIQETENGGFRISSSTLNKDQRDKVTSELSAKEESFEDLGPIIGGETRTKSFVAVIFAIVAITIYIAIAFWKSGGVISSWKFGISAIVALLHDVVITLGLFSLFGLLFGVQIDVLFITAILTIMGFSVHDTIVVFDRIRENIKNNVKKHAFETVVGNSIDETIGRSLNTSVTVLFVLFSMALFGGESIRWFVIAFLIGVIVGTYSSIFVAAPLLLEWHNFDTKGGVSGIRKKKIS